MFVLKDCISFKEREMLEPNLMPRLITIPTLKGLNLCKVTVRFKGTHK